MCNLGLSMAKCHFICKIESFLLNTELYFSSVTAGLLRIPQRTRFTVTLQLKLYPPNLNPHSGE